MTRNPHNEARELIAGGKGLSEAQQTWLRAHLHECEACCDYVEASNSVMRALRSLPLAADSRLVRATQVRVRSRAVELQRQQERRWVICICCAAVTLGTAFTSAVLWRGFAWMGQQAQLPAQVWQIGLMTFSLMPAIVAGILLLARGTYLADHNGSFQD
jgi:predicted anti-sigma-YlaC factor YlaD